MPRKKVAYSTTSRATYKLFRKDNPNMNISYDKFRKILYAFSYGIRDGVIETGDKISIPFGMGELSINKKKTRRLNKFNKIILPVDWVETKKHGRRIYNFNEHTEGYKFKWMWFRQRTRFPVSQLWMFKPSRKTSRKLAECLKEPNSQYQYIYREWKK